MTNFVDLLMIRQIAIPESISHYMCLILLGQSIFNIGLTKCVIHYQITANFREFPVLFVEEELGSKRRLAEQEIIMDSYLK